MPVLLGFRVLGMLMGQDGPGGIIFNNIEISYLVGSLTLAVILFDGGLRTDVRSFRVGLRPALSLASLGVLITALITGLAAAWLLELPWMYGLLIGAIVGSTDAAAVFSILHSQSLELKQRVGATLEIESGSNDPMAIFLTIALVEYLGGDTEHGIWSMLQTFALQFGLGGVVGILGGMGLLWLINRLRINAGLYPLLALGGALLVLGFTAVIDGSGFLAVYICGVIVANRPHQSANEIRRFHDGMAWLSQISMFLVLGLLVTPSELPDVAWASVAVSVLLIFVARPVAVALSLLPFNFPWREQVFIGWVGLRGAVPIILALIPLLAGLDQAAMIFNVTFFVVLMSLILQGWTVAPMARWLNLEVPPHPGPHQRVELSIHGRPDMEVVGYVLQEHCPVLGKPIGQLQLPGESRIIVAFRGEQVLGCEDAALALRRSDHVYLLTRTQDIDILDQLFVTLKTPKRLESHRFFGEFVLNAEARLADVAAVYGFSIPEQAGQDSVGGYLEKRLNLPVVGDRCEVGGVELVVREIQHNRITRVGLKVEKRGATR
jgi:cell volume regulation protein A